MSDPTPINETNFNARLNQIGHYSYENRMSMLFTFQLTFIFLLITIVLYNLVSMGVISIYLGGFIFVILLMILIFVYLTRFYVMSKLRSGKNWNNIRFDGDGTKKSPNIVYVPAGTDAGSSGSGVVCVQPAAVEPVCATAIP